MSIDSKVLIVADSSSPIAACLPTSVTVSSIQHLEEALRCGWEAVVLTDGPVAPEVALQILKEHRLDQPAIVVSSALNVERAMSLVRSGAADCLEMRRLATLPRVVADAVENYRHRLASSDPRSIEHGYLEQQMLLKIITRVRHSLDLDTIFQITTSEVRSFLKADRVIVYQFDAQFLGKTVAESVGPGWTPALGVEIIDTCFKETRGSQYTRDRILTTCDVRTAGLTPCHLALLERFEVRSNLVVPIFQDEQVWGLLIAHQCDRPRSWHQGEVDLLHQIAAHLTIAIRQAEWVLLTRERQAREERDRLLAVVDAIRQAVGLQAALDAAVLQLQRTLIADRVAVYRFNDDWSGTFVSEAAGPGWVSLMGMHDRDEVLRENISRCSARILGQGRSFVADTLMQETGGDLFPHPASFRIVEDIYQAGFSGCYLRVLEGYQARAYAIVPLFKGNVLWGLLAVYQNSGPRRWDQPEVNLLYQVATHLSVPLQQDALYQASQAQVIELERLARLKDDFLSTVSHELRTPISNMRVAIHLLHQVSDEERRSKYLAILERECSREITLVNNLLDLQRLDSHSRPLELEEVVLGRWLPGVVLPFFERTRERGQVLTHQASSPLPSIYTEASSLERIVVELLNNACKYTPAGEQIVVGLQRAGNHLELTVANTGPEIPATELPRIFEKFYRIPSTDPWGQGGTGLGLALVWRLTQRLGGRIWAESVRRTTTFTVALPLDLGLDYCPLPEYSLEANLAEGRQPDSHFTD